MKIGFGFVPAEQFVGSTEKFASASTEKGVDGFSADEYGTLPYWPGARVTALSESPTRPPAAPSVGLPTYVPV